MSRNTRITHSGVRWSLCMQGPRPTAEIDHVCAPLISCVHLLSLLPALLSSVYIISTHGIHSLTASHSVQMCGLKHVKKKKRICYFLS